MEIIEMTTAELSMLAGHTRGGFLLASRQGAGFDFGVGVRVVRPLGCNTEASSQSGSAQSLTVEPQLAVESGKGTSHKSNGPILASAQVQTALIAGVLADGPSTAVKRPGAYVGGTPPRGRETW